MTMPDTSTSQSGNTSASEIASIFQELQSAEKTADVIEGRLETLEKRLDELLAALEKEEEEEAEAKTEAEGRTTGS
jgi:predicted transcriptional regulator